MAAQKGSETGAKGSTSPPPDSVTSILPDIPRPKMIADCLAVLVVATFKINVRGLGHVAHPWGV